MLKLRINPIVAKDLKNIRDYIAEDNEEYAAKTIKEIYGKFENLQMFPGMGSDLSKRVSFRTDYKYAIWEDYVIIYKVGNEYVEIYRVVNRYQDITRSFYNVATQEEEYADMAHPSAKYHAKSHGESFLALAQNRTILLDRLLTD